ncbi:MAG: bifunctional oligoribonuclease/PAP phosphatase NrnA [Oscillospiraceae bacterium]
MMTNNVDVQKTAQLLAQADNILILCHKNPDGDTIGSAGALFHTLEEMNKTAAILCNDEFSKRYDFMELGLFEGQFKPKFVVAVDVATAQLLGEKTLPYSESVDLCIDHHPSNSGYAKMTCCDSALPATAQLMLEIIEAAGVAIDNVIADCLYTGIITDTGCFKYSATTAKTHIAAAKLMELGANHTEIADKFFMSKTRKNIELEKHALNTLEFLYGGRCAMVVLTKEILDKIQPEGTDIEGISAMPRAIDGVDIGVTLRQIGDNTFKISVRTGEGINASEIAQGLGGGGHSRAAGCEVVGSVECAKKAILREIEKVICE